MMPQGPYQSGPYPPAPYRYRPYGAWQPPPTSDATAALAGPSDKTDVFEEDDASDEQDADPWAGIEGIAPDQYMKCARTMLKMAREDLEKFRNSGKDMPPVSVAARAFLDEKALPAIRTEFDEIYATFHERKAAILRGHLRLQHNDQLPATPTPLTPVGLSPRPKPQSPHPTGVPSHTDDLKYAGRSQQYWKGRVKKPTFKPFTSPHTLSKLKRYPIPMSEDDKMGKDLKASRVDSQAEYSLPQRQLEAQPDQGSVSDNLKA
ncbi:uncharacterized protein K460DRAFT_420208 [Cucurbitaria berberidis CBS 394.84]|uniref:Uncharacterized protein n=1 Tax=Cucurbitaria berberidis CBS 394.84 TaxID=1168544 RepID=A0A9P4L4U3_9PLEO|nr:uncharacterized protein K460DRAFT_420208 [Cucurbitaria berberidis CBS 394.84]KAF1842286.1 hypothetical protein K460DRAFT_420208 [Cucurbitaria berberidis CBS 394.84]